MEVFCRQSLWLLCNRSTQTLVSRVISMRKNCPRFKHNCVCPARTCRHGSNANRDTLMTSAQHIMARALGTAVATPSCSCCTGQSHPGRPQELLWVAEEPCSKAAPRLGQCPEHILYSQLSADTMCVFGAGGSWRAAGCQDCRASASPSLPHDMALREGLQASVSCSGTLQPGHGSLTSQPSSWHPSLENLTILQGSTALKKIQSTELQCKKGLRCCPT